MLPHESLRIILEEHASLREMLRSLRLRVQRGPDQDVAGYFTMLRAILFCVDEFHERHHHPKESALLFPKLVAMSPELADVVHRLDQDHAGGEAAVRQLQHLLLAWEMIGASRRAAFEDACTKYAKLYLDHMQLEETAILPAAERCLSAQDWQQIDEAFAGNPGLFGRKFPTDQVQDERFSADSPARAAPAAADEVGKQQPDHCSLKRG